MIMIYDYDRDRHDGHHHLYSVLAGVCAAGE